MKLYLVKLKKERADRGPAGPALGCESARKEKHFPYSVHLINIINDKNGKSTSFPPSDPLRPPKGPRSAVAPPADPQKVFLGPGVPFLKDLKTLFKVSFRGLRGTIKHKFRITLFIWKEYFTFSNRFPIKLAEQRNSRPGTGREDLLRIKKPQWRPGRPSSSVKGINDA